MALIGVTSRGILIKLVLFYIIFFLDMFFTSFVEMSFKTDLSDGVDKYTVYALFAIQLATTFLLMGGFFVLMWSTFLLRFGLLGILLKNFKWTLATFLFYSIFFLGERAWRLLVCLNDEYKNCDVDIWDMSGYRFFYYIRHIVILLFYSMLAHSSLRISSPEYYKADKWLKK